MAWATVVDVCDRCGKTAKLYPAFGKKICLECKEARPKKGTGNAGLFQSPQEIFVFEQGLVLERVKKSDPTFGRLFFSHYPGSKGIPGRSLCYLINYQARVAGIIGFNSPPKNYGLFNIFFGKDKENNFLINNVFRLVVHEQNLATRVMKLARIAVKRDYEEKFGDALLGLVTFVELPRTGALYKADNWSFLGESAGKRMRRDPVTWDKVFTEGEVKLVFGYKYKEPRCPLKS